MATTHPHAETHLDAEAGRHLLAIARGAIAARLAGESYRLPAALPASLSAMGAAFVTLRRREDGSLRGCIGQTQARQEIAAAVAQAAVSAAFRDPRFPPLRPDELPRVHLDISCLSPMHAVDGPDAVVPGLHGVTLELRGHRGLFLPQVATEYGWDHDRLLEQLSLKAGLPPDAWQDPAARFEVFTATVFDEDA